MIWFEFEFDLVSKSNIHRILTLALPVNQWVGCSIWKAFIRPVK